MYRLARPALLNLEAPDRRQHPLIPLPKIHPHGHQLPEIVPRRDLAHHTRRIRLDPLRHQQRPPHDRLHAHPREADGLLGVPGHVDLVQPGQAHLGEPLLDVVGDVGVVRAPAGHVEFGDGLVRGREAVVVFADGLRRDAGERRDDVLGSAATGFDALDKFHGFLVAENFAPRRLGNVVLVPPVVVDVVVDDFLEAETCVNTSGVGEG